MSATVSHPISIREIGRKTMRIEASGEQIGQLNGLSVISLGNLAFGTPSRITAQVRLGRGEVVDIEREVELGGPLHSKGVLILGGFLGGRFGRTRPLSLNANLVFEQSYGGVDGDSASAAELFALLSALAEAPIKQCFAVTGSVDQRGQIQAIGGVNEKIEDSSTLAKRLALTDTTGRHYSRQQRQKSDAAPRCSCGGYRGAICCLPDRLGGSRIGAANWDPGRTTRRRRQLPEWLAQPADRCTSRSLCCENGRTCTRRLGARIEIAPSSPA
jgi:hypothetical protein